MPTSHHQTEAANILSSRASTKADEHERILLVQAEIERVRWLLRSYLRVRMDKLERFSAYIVRAGETGERGGQSAVRRKLSDVEWGYAERYAALVKQHFVTSVTQNIPERLRRLDEEEMIVKPDLEVAVFARALKNCPAIRLPDGAELEMQKGNIHMLRYKSIRRLLRDGDVRLV
ncbi:GINS complex subunit [Cystobasidiomycetes sp. EMM_F5]